MTLTYTIICLMTLTYTIIWLMTLTYTIICLMTQTYTIIWSMTLTYTIIKIKTFKKIVLPFYTNIIKTIIQSLYIYSLENNVYHLFWLSYEIVKVVSIHPSN